jgi:two-component system cell cycle sensor histidine kinase/response regulator CckA
MGTNNPRVPRTTGRKRVLCVDDDPAITRILVRWLDRHGFETIQTADPIEALAWIRQVPDGFDALITDQTMPNLTGLELACSVSRMRPGLVVFLATARDDRISPDDLLDARVSHLVAKPFDLRALVSALNDALDVGRPTLVAV